MNKLKRLTLILLPYYFTADYSRELMIYVKWVLLSLHFVTQSVSLPETKMKQNPNSTIMRDKTFSVWLQLTWYARISECTAR